MCETYSGKVNGLLVNSNACLKRRNRCSDWRACRKRENQVNERKTDHPTDRPNQRESEGRASDRTNERTKSSRSAKARSALFFSYSLQTRQIKINHFSWLLETNFVTLICQITVFQVLQKYFPSFSKLSHFLCILIFIICLRLTRKCF